MYLAGLLILGGAGVVLASATPFLAVPAFAWAVRNGYILREERMLEERFGSAYDEYRSRVRRWI
jgi:protein-S-isoprenylcysteine O-methyltransferase Ste14